MTEHRCSHCRAVIVRMEGGTYAGAWFHRDTGSRFCDQTHARLARPFVSYVTRGGY